MKAASCSSTASSNAPSSKRPSPVDSSSASSRPIADERGPHNELKLKLEAVAAMSPEDQAVIISLIDAHIKKPRLEEPVAS